MNEKIAHVMHEIAVTDAWKIFAAFSVAAVLMVVPVLTAAFASVGRLGFVFFVVASFGWLCAVATELTCALHAKPHKVMGIAVLGLVCTLFFAFPGVAGPILPRGLNVPYFVGSGSGMLVAMIYLVRCVGPLLAKLEADRGLKAGVSATHLVGMWPVGVWFLQPRLQQVLSKPR